MAYTGFMERFRAPLIYRPALKYPDFGVGHYKFQVVAFNCIRRGAKLSAKLTFDSLSQAHCLVHVHVDCHYYYVQNGGSFDLILT